MINTFRNNKKSKRSSKSRNNNNNRKSKAIMPHLKWYQVAWSSSVNATGVVGFFLNPSSGTAANERIGDVLSPRIVNTKIITIAGDASNCLRLIFYQTFNGGFTAVGDLLQNGPTGFPDIQSQYQPYVQKYIKIYHDKTYPLVTGANNMERTIEVRFAPKLPQVYSSGTGTTASGNIQYILISDSGVSPHVAVTFNSLTWFSN
jgi:hypothetical protein